MIERVLHTETERVISHVEASDRVMMKKNPYRICIQNEFYTRISHVESTDGAAEPR